MMEHSTEWLIQVDAKYVGWIAKRQENWETFAREALIARTLLEERLTQLSPAERRQIEESDEQLVNRIGQLREILPAGGEHPRAHWWRHLHEGPHVRREAARTAA